MSSDASAEETLFRLGLRDWPADVVDRWWQAGVTDPGYAQRMRAAGASVDDAAGYVRCGLDPDTAERLFRESVLARDVQGWQFLGVDDPDDMITQTRGSWFRGGDVFDYFDADVHDADTIRAMRDAGLSGDDAFAYAEHGAGPDEMLDGHPGHPGQFAHLFEVGARGVDVIRRLIAGGAIRDEIQGRRHFDDPDRVDPHLADEDGRLDVDRALVLIDSGIPLGEALDFLHARVSDPDDMRRLIAAGVDHETALLFSDAGVTGAERILAFHEAGIDPDQAYAHHAAGTPGGPDEIKRLCAAGIGPEDAFGYTEAGVRQIDQMIELHRSGLSGVTLFGYSEVGVRDIVDVRRLVDAGVSAGDVEHFGHAHLTVDETIAAHQAGIPSTAALGVIFLGPSSPDEPDVLADARVGRLAVLVWAHEGLGVEEMVERWLAGERPLHDPHPKV